MSHRLRRSYSADGRMACALNSDYFPDYNVYRPSAMDSLDVLDYDQEFRQPYQDQYSRPSGVDEMDMNYRYSQPPKERRVTWAPMPEDSFRRHRSTNNSENRRYVEVYPSKTQSTRIFNETCPIHSHYRQGITMGERPRKLESYLSTYKPSTSGYDSRSASRRLSSDYDSYPYGQTEARFLNPDRHGLFSFARKIPRGYSNFSPLRNSFLNPGYRSSSASLYSAPSNSLMGSSFSFRKPKWSRSVIGLNRGSNFETSYF